MLSFESCESGWFALYSSINCESRNAQAMPAGPPPMMTTSASICGRSIPSIGLRKVIMVDRPPYRRQKLGNQFCRYDDESICIRSFRLSNLFAKCYENPVETPRKQPIYRSEK